MDGTKPIRFPFGEHGVDDEDGVLCKGGEYPPLLEIDEAIVRCLRVPDPEPGLYGPKLIFENEVLRPPEYAGTRLVMYANYFETPRPLSKIMHLAVIATGQRRIRNITKKMFQGKGFRCSLRTCGRGAAAYSVIDTFLERLEK